MSFPTSHRLAKDSSPLWQLPLNLLLLCGLVLLGGITPSARGEAPDTPHFEWKVDRVALVISKGESLAPIKRADNRDGDPPADDDQNWSPTSQPPAPLPTLAHHGSAPSAHRSMRSARYLLRLPRAPPSQ